MPSGFDPRDVVSAAVRFLLKDPDANGSGWFSSRELLHQVVALRERLEGKEGA